MNENIKFYGHSCNACKYYDVGEGFCTKTNSHHYGYEEKCPHWKIADDLVKHRKKKSKNYEQLNLL